MSNFQTASELSVYLDRFEDKCRQAPGPIPYSFLCGDTRSPWQCVFLVAIHGNEVGSIPAMLLSSDLIDESAKAAGIKLVFAIGNPDAVVIGKRFVANDLNRLFADIPHACTPEHIRAQQLKDLIRSSSCLIDFHQTIQPTQEPFYIFTLHGPSAALAQALGCASAHVVDLPFKGGELSADQFAQSVEIPGISIELGQAGLNQSSIELATELIFRFVQIAKEGEGALSKRIEKAAMGMSPLRQFEMDHFIPFEDPKDHLLPGWKNLDPVKAEQQIGVRANGKPIVSPKVGVVLFPKYPVRDEAQKPWETIPKHICCIAVACDGVAKPRFASEELIRPREANNLDCKDVQNLVFSVLREFGIEPEPNGIDADLADIESHFFRVGGYFEVLVDPQNKVLGTAGLMPLSNGSCELRKMYFAPQIRGKGIGKVTLRRFIEKARELGFRSIELETSASMTDAIRLYKRFGFRSFSRDLHTGADLAFTLDL